VPKEHLTADELKVLTLREWAKLNSLSFQTARRVTSLCLMPVSLASIRSSRSCTSIPRGSSSVHLKTIPG
jgi:hypothetical protein